MRSRTKVLFITHDMRSGGVERVFSEILRCLDPQAFDLHLALHRAEIVFPVPENVTIHEIGLRKFWQFPGAVLALSRLIRTVKPDLVVPGAINPCLVMGEAVRLVAERPATLAIIVNNPKREPGWRQPWVRRSYRVMDGFLTLTHDLKDLAVATYKFIEPERIRVWTTGLIAEDIVAKAAAPIDESLFDRPVLIAVARLHKQKRFDIMIDAFRRVRSQTEARLVIIGDGSLRTDLTKQIDALDLTDSVHLLGFQANPYPWLARAHMLLLSSDYEGLSTILIEAQLLGVPAVATDCPTGCSEIVSAGETGLLVPTGDPDALAAAVLTLLGDDARRRRMGEAARERAASLFDARNAMPKLAEILHDAARGGPGQ